MTAPDPARAAAGRGRRRGLAAADLLPAGRDLCSRSRSGRTGRLLARTGGGALWMAALLAALLPVDRLVEPDRAVGRARPARPARHQRGERRARQARRPLAELRPAADARRDPRRGADEAAARTCWCGSSSACSLGTPGLAALTLGVAALTAGLRRSGALAGLLMLPLAVPLLIFGAGFVERGNESGRAAAARRGLAAAGRRRARSPPARRSGPARD